ncbi:MAG: SGNH/GDSL hydrolase family protein [Vicinamibacterales bacterium]
MRGVTALVCGIVLALHVSSAAQTQEERYRRLLSDWASLNRFGSENTEVPPPAPGEARVVFIGDQITEMWTAAWPKIFASKPYFNRGISGQVTAQMLVRFRQDVIALKPKVVVIHGGINDITGASGPGSEGMIADQIKSMTELATANGIRVVIASLTPVCDCVTVQTGYRSQARIIGVNGFLRDYAKESGSVYVDYYSALAVGRDFKRELTVDGVIPNDAGYAVMASLADQAIARALEQR